ncbi:ParB N-terminal domain-containing protein [Streptomyces osmaniensis]|uniref:ParB/Sulfiredoxin domain-containing protein n=1 Tax=Streptomyces osmaniensis TaxID=593134 RepID=A0ABP6YXN8_9ACTN|nr:ParB N-terminal domain-containing protein [Streptomyces sp. JCM17656]
MTNPSRIPLAELFRDYENGDQSSWSDERAWITTQHPRRLARIRDEIQSGFFPPVRLDFAERRVVDGHHRLIAAEQLGLEDVPVADAWDDSGWAEFASPQGDDDKEEASA